MRKRIAAECGVSRPPEITMGLVLAALIVGASMLVQVETAFEILGHPGLAMIPFILAAGGGGRWS